MLQTRSMLAVSYAAVAVTLLAMALQGGASRLGTTFPGFLVWDNGVLVAFYRSSWTGVRADLPFSGAVLSTVEGAPYPGGRQFLDAIALRSPGEQLRYEFLVDGEPAEYSVPTMTFGLADFAATYLNYAVAAAALFGIGGLALFLRPELPAARALALAAGAGGSLLALVVDYLSAYRLVALCQVVEALVPVAVLHLSLVFPEERLSPRSRRRLVGVATGLLLANGVTTAIVFQSRPELARNLVLASYVCLALAVLIFAVSVARSTWRASTPPARLQAAVVLAGTLPAALLLAVPTLGFALLGWPVSSGWSTIGLPLVSVAILYGIVRHDLLEAERFVRLTAGYSVATAGVIGAYAAGITAIERLLPAELPLRSIPGLALVLASALLFGPLHRRVQRYIDRIFFRTPPDLAAVLEASSAELVRLRDAQAIVTAVEELATDALSLEWARVAPTREPPDQAEQRLAIRFGADRLGDLFIGPKRSGAPFSAAELEFLAAIADQTALALHNARAIHDLNEAQQEQLVSERLATIGEFARAVAHGLRNPLSGVRAAAQRSLARPPDLDSILGDIVHEVDRLDRRIRALLEFSRRRDPQAAEVELAPLVQNVAKAVGSVADRAGVSIEFVSPEATCSATADPDLLFECLLELAANGIRAMPNGGTLRLSLSESGPPRIRVSDQGVGVPPGVRDRIFDLFFTTRVDGTGVGLTTVRRILESQGASVGIIPGDSGTTFEIVLPR